MNKSIIITLFLMQAAAAYSQKEKGTDTKGIAISLYTNSGVRLLNKEKPLNHLLVSNALPAFSTVLFVSEKGIGLSWHKLYALYLARSYSFSDQTKYPSSSGNGKGNELRVHFRLLQHNRFTMYPFVGIGGQSLSLHCDSNPEQLPATIKNALNGNNSSQSIALSVHNQATISAGISLNYRLVSLFNNSTDLCIGGNIGYVSVIRGGQWRVNQQLTDYSNGSFDGLDIKLSGTIAHRLKY